MPLQGCVSKELNTFFDTSIFCQYTARNRVIGQSNTKEYGDSSSEILCQHRS